MPHTNNTETHLSDAILRAMLACEAGQADAVVFTCTHMGMVKSYTVGGMWMGDVFSWRMASGKHDKLAPGQGEEIYGGTGEDELDVMYAAARLSWKVARMVEGNWTVA
jgi:hypothetical protein